ncbi:pseudouridine synthase [Prolixibacteraceae bacterium Z1-6]|uniref:Pseudouridine synthase n=1 Tax=Draconibacterium aestuarii TaxID=2998507 RepID=A0A9X3FIX0_9BACT|nr:pseudouridine synthase [Prolixibacteraceae bacterium Z1-6]
MRKSNSSGRGGARQDNKTGGPSKRTSSKTSGKREGKSRVIDQETSKKEFSPRKTYKKPFVKKGLKKTSEPKTNLKTVSSEGMRLNRFVANAGVCSRREADTYIEAGMVTINGKQVTEMGMRVMPGDEVRFDGRKLDAEKKVYLLLNKPKDYVTTTDDPHADKIVMDLIKDACAERVYPVGRLDRNTTGLLLFTNDGDLSKKLTHPSHNKKKIYQVTLDKPVIKAHLEMIAEGIELEDGPIAADAISYAKQDDKTEIGIEIHSGKNRIVRRIFEHFGYKVRKLDRVLFAGLTKKNLPRGKYRFLTDKEIQFLKMM